ncbi:SRPBCC domain-containing protein [Saccharopolyspora sp. NPDC050642]|uniref:SRPBCC domain-containing protein n=1 Tax=Saccharopolyspora sp. NPDC050642 TaxID=3157099 RepID=UPI0033C2F408
MLDVSQQIDFVRRKVGKAQLNGNAAHATTMSQTFRADVDDVWGAVTDPERIAKWFSPVSGELRFGGEYQVEGNANGTIERCEPPKGFTATWETSEHAKEFTVLSSQRWGDANIAGGADPNEAQAMADRTTAAYTGEAE